MGVNAALVICVCVCARVRMSVFELVNASFLPHTHAHTHVFFIQFHVKTVLRWNCIFLLLMKF